MPSRCPPACALALLLVACGQHDPAPLELPPLVQRQEQGGAAGTPGEGDPGGSTTGTSGNAGAKAGGSGGGNAGISGASGEHGGKGGAGGAGAGAGGETGGVGAGGGLPSLCEGKNCGEPCAACDPSEQGCDTLLGACDSDGQCRLDTVFCTEARCQSKSCGEPCDPCPPGHPSCFPGFCGEAGVCFVTAPGCGGAGPGTGGAGGLSGSSGQGGTGSSGEDGGCQVPEDCPALPCEICPNGAENCPLVSCVEGHCAVAVTPCPPSCADFCNFQVCELCWDGSLACQSGQCVEETCVQAVEDCPPKPDCTPVEAKGQGPCAQVLGFVWDGADCTGIAGCSCVGAGCDQVAATYEQCATARSICFPVCAGKLCGDPCEECGDGGCVGGLCDGAGVCAGPTPCP